MQPESTPKTELEADSPGSNINVGDSQDNNGGRPSSSGKASATQNGATNGQFPPPKTDKPRPHVCGTCGRSFARLEHLKRHERSHTKEKPFECPECTRCFARRDLLLRHQQKLHMTNTTSSRPRNGRRESVSTASATSGRVRKNSAANGAAVGAGGLTSGMTRPRANTISHIDLSGLGMLDGTNTHFSRLNALGINAQPMGLGGLGGAMNFDYRGMSTAFGNHGTHGLPKLDTHIANDMDVANSLRTAPPYASFGGFDIDQLFSPGTTINPAQLHSGGFGGAATTNQPSIPALEPFTVHSAIDPQAQVDDFGWMRNWNMQLSHDGNEHAIDESSPSRISSGDSPGDYNENMNASTANVSIQGNYHWHQQQDSRTQHRPSIGPFQLDALGSGLPNLDAVNGTMSPNTLNDPTPTGDMYFPQAMLQQQQHEEHNHFQQQQQHPQHQAQVHSSPQAQVQQDAMLGQQQTFFAPSSLSNLSSDSPSISSSMTGSARQSSVTSLSTDSITEATRQALLMTLAQPSVFGISHRKYSQPTVSSPLSPSGAARSSGQGPTLPSTADIRRYVDAFMQFAQPHVPVIHLPTLSFDSIEFPGGIKAPSSQFGLQNGLGGGGGCLILGMAAIGALYEYDHPASKELFDAARKVISLYLEERRKADMSAAVTGTGTDAASHTPLWLVQAMLLNVLYGHQCGDKTAADVASVHSSALVSLARAADLAQAPDGAASPATRAGGERHQDEDMMDPPIEPNDSVSRHQSAETDLHAQWITWKTGEERKRTLFAIFILSSVLTTAYNHVPTIMNSEILLDLPCEEELYSAETAQEWHNRGGLAAAEQNSVTFADALSTLLTANQRQRSGFSSTAYNSNNPLGALQAGDAFASNDLRPSTFGCLVLINALHNYIWETRSRHHGRQWTPQETESMFSHIEPALNAWQAAWKANPHHKLERPNPFGLGPLAADSVPLLDLAFVRLFVNLGRSKEAFWSRDFDGMADELARGSEIVQHAESSPTGVEHDASNDAYKKRRTSQDQSPNTTSASSSRRERHLRKAAFYAADSLTIACSYNLTYADMVAHELPVQSAMCFFDCSQVLAEWVCTVQERVGTFLGVLGRDAFDYTQVPAIMLLETEDVELLRKIDRICDSLEAKRFQQENLLAMEFQNINPGAAMNTMGGNVNLSACGYGSKILRIVAMMLEKAVVWPVTHVMAKALETQAMHMDQRAEDSSMQSVDC